MDSVQWIQLEWHLRFGAASLGRHRLRFADRVMDCDDVWKRLHASKSARPMAFGTTPDTSHPTTDKRPFRIFSSTAISSSLVQYLYLVQVPGSYFSSAYDTRYMYSSMFICTYLTTYLAWACVDGVVVCDAIESEQHLTMKSAVVASTRIAARTFARQSRCMSVDVKDKSKYYFSAGDPPVRFVAVRSEIAC